MHRAIVFTSGKGGVGKSTLTLCVGKALAENARVVLLDTDIGLNNLDVIMDLEQRVIYDIDDVIENRCRLSQALIEYSGGLFLMPSSHSYEQCRADGQNLKEVVRRLKTTFDFVLIDCPAGIEFGFHRAVAAADEAIVVTTAHLSALKDAATVAELIASYKIPASLVINRVRGDLMASGETFSISDIAGAMKPQIIGVVPESDEINELSSGAAPKKSEGMNAIALLARNIRFSENELYDAAKKYKGFFGGIKRRLKGRL